MNAVRTAPTVGALSCLLVAILVGIPYLLLSGTAAQGLGTYYAVGLINPPVVGVLAIIGAIVFLSGREDRSDPGLVAGIMIVVGAVMAMGTLTWAFGPAMLVAGSLGEVAWLGTHRLVLAFVTLLVPASAGWYARALGVI